MPSQVIHRFLRNFNGIGSHCASSSGPFIIGVLDPLSVRNTIVTGDFFGSNPNAVIRLVLPALILAWDFDAWSVDVVTTEHLGLCNQFLAHVIPKHGVDPVSQRSVEGVGGTYQEVAYESATRRLIPRQRQVFLH